jgi:hypothetical protein
MTTALAIRLPELEWAHRASSGALRGLAWVDLRNDPELTPLRQSGGADEGGFRPLRHLRFVTPPVVDGAVAFQKAGRVTAWDGLALLFSKVTWLVEGRRTLWAPGSPVPKLLASMAATFGAEPAIHGNDPENLARLVALLPTWHPHRGTVLRARQLLETCGQAGQLDGALVLGDKASKSDARLADEVFACHDLDWWSHRAAPGAEAAYRITDEFVRFQPEKGEGFPLRREDVLLPWTPTEAVPKDALRLLPPWTNVRLAISTVRS